MAAPFGGAGRRSKGPPSVGERPWWFRGVTRGMLMVVNEGVVSQATGKVNGRLIPRGSECGEGAEQELRVGQVGEDGVGLVAEEVGGRVAAPRRDGDGARAEVAGAGDVVGRVADDDELPRVEVLTQVPAEALARDGG